MTCGVEMSLIPSPVWLSSRPGGDGSMHKPGGGCDGSVSPTSPVQTVALDIQAAYVSVWKAGLLEKLVAKGVSGTLISWI